MSTREQVAGALELLKALGEAIREAGQITYASLYAMFPRVMYHDQFEHLIGILARSGRIKRHGELLIWAE